MTISLSSAEDFQIISINNNLRILDHDEPPAPVPFGFTPSRMPRSDVVILFRRTLFIGWRFAGWRFVGWNIGGTFMVVNGKSKASNFGRKRPSCRDSPSNSHRLLPSCWKSSVPIRSRILFSLGSVTLKLPERPNVSACFLSSSSVFVVNVGSNKLKML